VGRLHTLDAQVDDVLAVVALMSQLKRPSPPGRTSSAAVSVNQPVMCSGSVITVQTTSIGASMSISRSMRSAGMSLLGSICNFWLRMLPENSNQWLRVLILTPPRAQFQAERELRCPTRW
jgi:hypothetical protein